MVVGHNLLKNIVAGIRQGKQVAREDRRWLAMLEEEACRRKVRHAPMCEQQRSDSVVAWGACCRSSLCRWIDLVTTLQVGWSSTKFELP